MHQLLLLEVGVRARNVLRIGANISFREGQYFSNANCAILGRQIYEWAVVRSGRVMFTLAASEAVVVYLKM